MCRNAGGSTHGGNFVLIWHISLHRPRIPRLRSLRNLARDSKRHESSIKSCTFQNFTGPGHIQQQEQACTKTIRRQTAWHLAQLNNELGVFQNILWFKPQYMQPKMLGTTVASFTVPSCSRNYVYSPNPNLASLRHFVCHVRKAGNEHYQVPL